MSTFIEDVLEELNALKALSLSRRLQCNCIKVPIKDGHGERMVCPLDCPHLEFDTHIANALVFAEMVQKGK